MTSLAEKKEKKKEVPKLPIPPPQPVSQEITVNRGEAIEVRLSIYGRKNENLKYLIRSQPEGGKVTEPKVVSQEASVVTYQSPADLRVKRDRFTYAVQNSAGVSAPAEVKVTIVDLDPQLIVPEGLDFGQLLTGKLTRKEIEISNIGGAISEGEVQVPAPWRLEGSAAYRLGHKESQKMTLVFAPAKAGTYKGEIRYTSQLDRVTTLRGVGEAAIAPEPAELVLEHIPGDPTRSARLELLNNTDTEQTLSISADSRVQVAAMVTIPSREKRPVIVTLPENDVTTYEDKLRISNAEVQLEVPARAPAVGAVLKVEPTTLRFSGVKQSQAVSLPINLSNVGGREGSWKWQVPPPFSIEPQVARLAPGQKQEVRVVLSSRELGRFYGALRFEGEGHTQEISMEAEVVASSVAPPLPTVAARPKPARAAARPRPRASASAQGADVTSLEEEDPEAAARIKALLYLKNNVAVSNLGQNRATVEWPNSLASGRPCRVELRTVYMGEEGKVRVRWQVPSDLKISSSNGRTYAEIGGLPTASSQTVRVVPEGEPGAPQVPLFQSQFQTLPPEAHPVRITGFRLAIMALIALAIGSFAWHRLRQSR